jgi:hypothetical protein
VWRGPVQSTERSGPVKRGKWRKEERMERKGRKIVGGERKVGQKRAD